MASNASDINGRVKYIDPTNVSFFNREGKEEINYIPNDNLVFNSLEDYCIAADLEVMIPNRKACGWAMEDGNYKTLHYSTSEGTISFLHGTDGVLTTNFTDINPLMPDDKMHECLGIESINISFESWLTPLVNIKFVDVRGASVLAPEDKSLLTNDGTGGSLYRALFTYPPPMFKLKIKGFYGKGVTYYLVNDDIKLELDASSGNFNINARFIGMMYRVYVDMPMSFVSVAPYLANGKEYWNEMVGNGTFSFTDRDGSPKKMRPLPEILKAIWDISKSPQKESAAAKREEISESTNQRIDTIKNLIDTCPLKEWLSSGNRVYIGTTKTKEVLGKEISDYIARIEAYDKAYGTLHFPVFESLAKYGEREIKHDRLEIGKKNGYKDMKALIYSKNTDNKFVIDKDSEIDETEAGVVSGTEPFKYVSNMLATCKENTYHIYVLSEVNTEAIQTFLKNMPEESRKVEEELKKEIDDYVNLENQLIEDALGFSPTIKNIYNLIFAHMDTFIHSFYKNTDVIYEKLKTEDESREIAKVFGGGVATDTVNSEEYLPPYTEIFEKKEENGVTKNVSVWPGKMPGGKSLEEVDFVLDLLSAVKIYQETVDKFLDERNSGNTSSDIDFMRDAPSPQVDRMLPGTLYDVVNKDGIGNPYQWISNQVRNLSDEDFCDAIVGTFLTRAYYYLMGVNEPRPESANDFGKLDAINLAKGLKGIENDPRFENFVRQCKDRGKFVDTVLKRVKTQGASKMWNFGGKRLLDENNKYVLTGNYIPVGFGDFKDINAAYAGGSAQMSNDKRFINANKKDEEKETFVVYDSRDYVKALSDSIKSDVGTNYEGVITENQIDSIFAESSIDTTVDKNEIIFEQGIIYRKGASAKTDTIVKNSKENGVVDIANKSYKEREDYFVKYPALIDEDRKKSLFSTKIYTDQKDILSKAYLFLSAIPLKSKKEHQGSGINKNSENGVEQKARLLREGSFYWRDYVMGNNGDKDPIIHEGKPVGRNETFMGYNAYVAEVETVNEDAKKFVEWKIPTGSTASRRSVLRKKFEDWARNEYEKVEHILTDKSYYEHENFSNGFNSDLLRIEGASAIARNAERVQEFLLSTFLDVCTIVDYHGDGQKPNAGRIEAAFNGFVGAINDMFKDNEKNEETADASSDVTVEDLFRNDDIRLSTYQTLKTLYDKWLCAPYKGRNTWSMANPNSDFNQFIYLDTYYHNIGNVLLVNVSNVERWIAYCMPSQITNSDETVSYYFGKSVFDFLSEIAQNSGGMLMTFPQMIGGQTANHVAEMFKAFPYNSDWETDSSCFCFMYTYAPSKYIGSDEYEDDGFDLVTEQHDFLNDSGRTIPAFGVSYGKQNQAFFKNISLNTETPTVTNASIQAMLYVASKAGDGERETTAFGQDIYKVRSSYAFTCEFDMMGCMMVSPLMYFQLNNIPLWRGAYLIYKVTHQMVAGDMTTHVVGVRINKYALPMVEGVLPVNKDTQPRGESDGANGGENCGPVNTTNSMAESTNIEGNPDKKISDRIDFTETNISEKKPIICITPAHGPKTEKKMEHAWSSKLIDGYIIPKLQKLKFSDGTSYAQNIQRCNKGGNHTGSNGYSMAETRGLIDKYGSKKVISVVPHWNGGGGKYYCVFDGKAYSDGTVKVRDDSKKFAEILREEVRKMVDKSRTGLYALLPKGAMNGGVKSSDEEINHILSIANTDGAVQLNCACILSENWFADYDIAGGPYGNGGTSEKWYREGVWNKEDEEGKYNIMRGWIESEEGLNAIADAHVEAIRRYINTL